MDVAAAIAQHVPDVPEGNSWTEVSLAATLAEATIRTPGSPNTMASLVRHLAF